MAAPRCVARFTHPFGPMLWRQSWTFGATLKELIGIASDATVESIASSIETWLGGAIDEATNVLTGTLPDAAAPKDQHIESCINGRFLSETSDSGGIKSTRGNEGGWAGVNNKPVVTADANYYDRAQWRLVPLGGGEWLIESSVTGRYLFETSDSGDIRSIRGNEGGWAGVNNRPVVTADMNYYDRDCWKVTLPDAAPVPSKGEEACEGHGYGKASCAEVGCCQYAECSIGDGSGECFSAVGTAQCTPVEFSSHVETCP